MKFFPRLQEPDLKHPCYTYLPKDCMMFGDSVLPNCCGYTIGRIIEVCGDQGVFVPVNANRFFDYHKSFVDHGNVPKLGAIACWDNHIANVEVIYENMDFDASQSHYNGVRFDLEHLTKASGYSYRGHKFLGFLYLPIDFEGNPEEKDTGHDTCNYEAYDTNYYRVRASWEDARSQVGAYKYYDNAVAKAKETGLHCYDAKGRQVI